MTGTIIQQCTNAPQQGIETQCQHSGPAFRHLTPLLFLSPTSNHGYAESGFWCGSLAHCRVIEKKEDIGNIKAKIDSFELLATL